MSFENYKKAFNADTTATLVFIKIMIYMTHERIMVLIFYTKRTTEILILALSIMYHIYVLCIMCKGRNSRRFYFHVIVEGSEKCTFGVYMVKKCLLL